MTDEDLLKHGCQHCSAVIGETYWKGGPLPWVFCKKQCARDYYEKDGPTDGASLVRGGAKGNDHG